MLDKEKSDSVISKTIKIEGMSCCHCVMTVQKNLSKIKLRNFKVAIGSAIVDFDENEISEDQIIKAIEEAGYNVVK